MPAKLSDAQLAERVREQRRKYTHVWRQKVIEYARSQGFTSPEALLSALVRGEVVLIKPPDAR